MMRRILGNVLGDNEEPSSGEEITGIYRVDYYPDPSGRGDKGRIRVFKAGRSSGFWINDITVIYVGHPNYGTNGHVSGESDTLNKLYWRFAFDDATLRFDEKKKGYVEIIEQRV